ncbi:hypothetical protein [Pseudaminobacter sp. NGMCC 1.201702]|uniref:hypothetical protein n=1 Tax=Pseudaminobacter sp. NGMCC 1.201702 TaxID=3391825 RepID=UPI0039F0BC1F
MRKTVLAGIVALSASTSYAQNSTAPDPNVAQEPPAAQTATPVAPPTMAPSDPAAQNTRTGRPANLCQELLAFMKAPPEAAAPAAGAKPAAAPPQQAAPAQQAGTSGSSGAAPPKSPAQTGSAQEVTGQRGVATDSPAPNNAKVATGTVTNAPQKESRAAPLPPDDVTSTPKESVITVEKAEELAAANDIAVCQKTARDMRLAGVAMPPPLLALTALDLKFQQTAEPAAPPAGADNPAPQDPASQTQTPQ